MHYVKVTRHTLTLLFLCTVGYVGCSMLGINSIELPSTSTQTLEYYPRLVKGYENSYPRRRLLVLRPAEAREFKDPTARDHEPDNGNPAIGVALDQEGMVVQRLYSAPFADVVQKAIERAADEAGLASIDTDQISYTAGPERLADYVLESRITRCWVKKQRGRDGRYGPVWRTNAQFAVAATVYEPPFHTPFWQGESSDIYDDPPIRSYASGEDEAGIYDEPGQVLSIAMTRAVAGIFKRDDLRVLMTEDPLRRH